jgi:hypothetical protein
MSDTRNLKPAVPAGTADVVREPEPTGWVGWIVFAGAMLIVIGGFQAMMGFVALFKPGYYLVTRNGLVVPVQYSVWGWVHLVLGAVAFIAGLGVLIGQTWARVVAIIMAVVGVLVNIAFIAAYPVWITILVVLNVIVIYALAVHGREMRAYRDVDFGSGQYR